MGMNPKFFDVKKEKQDAIINAALMVFAENGYRKASTDVIVKEAGISKGLLFHYFISKQGVYEFIYDYSVKYMMLELAQSVRKNETDFFTIQRMIELAKTRVMKNYPYMQQFLSNVKYETHPDALKVIKSSDKMIDDAYNGIYKKADMSRFSGPVDIQKIIRMIGWMSDGYIKDKFRDGTPDLDAMNAEFAEYLSMLRDHFYGVSAKGQTSGPQVIEIASEEVERDDSIMDSMRDELMGRTDQPEEKESAKAKELSFEERLALGKRSAYEEVKTEETAEPDTDETETRDEAAVDEPADETADEAAAENTEAVKDETDAAEAEAVEAEDEAAAETAEAGTEEEPVNKEDTVDSSDEPKTEASEENSEEAAVDDEGAEGSEDTGAEDKAEAGSGEEKTETIEEVKDNEPEPRKEVTISIDSFDDGYRYYDGYGAPDSTYAASSTVASYVPNADIAGYYETSRLGDFTYGADARGGRGIPYDSSENIQIFVEEDDDSGDSDDDFDISDLSDKIMSNTDRETAEAERNKELESMGPAPVLPEFSPDKLRRGDSSIDDNNENVHMYRPTKF